PPPPNTLSLHDALPIYQQCQLPPLRSKAVCDCLQNAAVVRAARHDLHVRVWERDRDAALVSRESVLHVLRLPRTGLLVLAQNHRSEEHTSELQSLAYLV